MLTVLTMTSELLTAERDRLRKQLAMYQFADRWTLGERQEMRVLEMAIASISAQISVIKYGNMTKKQREEWDEWAENRFVGTPKLSDAVQQIKDFYENRDR